MAEKPHARQDAMDATGMGNVDEGTIPETTLAQSTVSDDAVEYTFTVTDSDGELVGSTTVADSFPLEEYGNRVLFANVGDFSSDGDNGIVDSIRDGDGEVIEDWSDRDLSDYTMTKDGGGRFELTTDPVASGPRALRSFTGARTSRITSDDDLVSIEGGVEIRGEVRHETDNSSSYAMQTGFGVGVDENGQGGIRLRLINPGSQRTAGARFTTPNGGGRIRFTPELEEFYTFSIAVQGGASGGLVWETATDWDDAPSESGVVHESVANTDHVDAGIAKQGYSVAEPMPSLGLVGYWPLQEDSGGTAFDFSGNGNHGTVHGVTPIDPGLLATSAYSFDGSDDYVDTGVSQISTPFTFAAWINPDAIDSSAGQYAIVENRNGGSSDDVYFSHSNTGAGDGNVIFLLDRIGEIRSGGGVLSSGEWSFIVGTVDSSQMALYVNGRVIGTAGGGSRTFDNGANLYIGNRPEENRPFDGQIAEVRIYDRALSASEVQTLYDVVAAPGTLTTDRREVPE